MRLNEIHRRYREDVEFFCVYVAEAHPQDGWQLPMNVEDGIVFYQPTTDDERAEVASVCMLKLDFEMPMLLDNMQNEVDEKYIALPERLFVIDKAGNVAWHSAMGPWGFDPAGWEAAIAEQVPG